MLQKVMYFIDGENLVFRYQDMKSKGHKPFNGIKHVENVYVWHSDIIKNIDENIVRVTYYTSATGDDAKILQLNNDLKEIDYLHRCLYGADTRDIKDKIFPRVFKKPADAPKSKGVDINMTIDMLHYSALGNLDAVYLISGDGDFIPLIREVMRNGVRVYLLALSSGLNPQLPCVVDRFDNIDNRLFYSS